jgi:hypothetical protein
MQTSGKSCREKENVCLPPDMRLPPHPATGQAAPLACPFRARQGPSHGPGFSAKRALKIAL